MKTRFGRTRRRGLWQSWPAVFGLALTLLLGACAAAEVQPGEPLLPGSDHGLVVLSLTRTGWRDYDLLLDLKGPGQWLGRPIVIFADGQPHDWRGDETWKTTRPEAPEGRLVVLRLAPGTYRIARWDGNSARDGAYGDGYWMYSAGDLELSFTVEPGSVRYAGNINLALPPRPSFVSGLATGTYTIDVKELRERDLSLLRTRFPGSDTDAMRSVAVTFPQAGQPLRYYAISRHEGGADPLTQ